MHDCKLVIGFVDHMEAEHPLTNPELALHRAVKDILAHTIKDKVDLWRQRSKIRIAMDGDENSCFFHFCVFAHRRTNKTDVLEFGGHVLYNHTQKVSVLHDFYHSLLGVSRPITWKFDHATLYPNQNSHLSELDVPFCTEEYESIIRCMKKDSSPRPYGFGTSFYSATWDITSSLLHDFCSAFRANTVYLGRIYISFIVLLLKKDSARSLSDFCPICL